MRKQLSKVMSKAWEMARKASNKFGNKVSEYIGESMKIAWVIVRSERGSVKLPGNKWAAQVNGVIRQLDSVPALEGSPKQIAWAEDIRRQKAGVYLGLIQREEYVVKASFPWEKDRVESKPVKGLAQAMVSEKKIIEYFEKMEAQGLPKSRMESAVKSMNALLDRMERAYEVLKNPSAKFWIDNRDFNDAKVQKYIQSGE